MRQFVWKVRKGSTFVDRGSVVAGDEREALRKVLEGRRWEGRGWKLQVGGTMASFDEEDVGLLAGQARGGDGVQDTVGIKELVASDALAKKLAEQRQLEVEYEEWAARGPLSRRLLAGEVRLAPRQFDCEPCRGTGLAQGGTLCTHCCGYPRQCARCAGLGRVDAGGADCHVCLGRGRTPPNFGGWPAAAQQQFQFQDEADREREDKALLARAAADIRAMLRAGRPPDQVARGIGGYARVEYLGYSPSTRAHRWRVKVGRWDGKVTLVDEKIFWM